MKNIITTVAITLASITSMFAQLPDPGFTIDDQTAIVITDPQNDFLSPDGVTWGSCRKKCNRKPHCRKFGSTF